MFQRFISDHIAIDKAIYLAAIVERAILVCSLDCQTTGLSPSETTYPICEQMLVGSWGSSLEYRLAKSASTQQLSFGIPVDL